MKKFLFIALCVLLLIFWFLLFNVSNIKPNPNIVENGNEISINFASRISCNYRLGIDVPYSNFATNPIAIKSIPVNIDFEFYDNDNLTKKLTVDKLNLQSGMPSEKIISYGIYTDMPEKQTNNIKIYIHYLPKELSRESKWYLAGDSFSFFGCFKF